MNVDSLGHWGRLGYVMFLRIQSDWMLHGVAVSFRMRFNRGSWGFLAAEVMGLVVLLGEICTHSQNGQLCCSGGILS